MSQPAFFIAGTISFETGTGNVLGGSSYLKLVVALCSFWPDCRENSGALGKNISLPGFTIGVEYCTCWAGFTGLGIG